MESSAPDSSHTNPPRKKQKRSSVACQRCHTQKIKCTGEVPCRACIVAKKADDCRYPYRARKMTVTESYLRRLQASAGDSRHTRSATTPHESEVEDETDPTLSYPGDPSAPKDAEVVNPLFEIHSGNSFSESRVEPAFIGESACQAFGDRLLQYIDKNYIPQPPVIPGALHHDSFNRMASEQYKLPERIHAKLLIQIAHRYLGKDQHLFLRKTFMEEVEAVYSKQAEPNPVWLCKLFGLLALGELYTNSSRRAGVRGIPGSEYFSQATDLLQDLYESGTVLQVEVLLLLAFYANTLGRVRSAYTYTGIAMRTALALGMHRSCSLAALTAVEQENRRRVWWSVYYFDRYTCSKLGQPVTLRDDEIDTELPSMEGLSLSEQEEFADPAHLCATVKLAKITGNILTEVYCLPHTRKGPFVQRVRNILKQLRDWDSSLPGELVFRWESGPRHVSSLHMAYQYCIIQTTRPVLFHLFKSKFHLGHEPPKPQSAPLSRTVRNLAESCIHAARTSNTILCRLFIDGTLVKFGYWDAHYLFSSTLIIMISAVLDPNPATSDAVQTAFNILRSMRDDGNIPATDYYQRLGTIQQTLARMVEETNRAKATRGNDVHDVYDGRQYASDNAFGQTGTIVPDHAHSQPFDKATDQATIVDPLNFSIGGSYAEPGVLANPFMDQFLADVGWPAINEAFDVGHTDCTFEGLEDGLF